MIGDKRLEMPKTREEIGDIYHNFGLYMGGALDTSIRHNAETLVILNNEVYDKYKCFNCPNNDKCDPCTLE